MIKLKICGICGSDINNIVGKSCMPTEKLGHEISGVISKVGINVSDFKIGDRVFVHHHCSCNVCYYCKHGNKTMCLKFSNNIEPNGFSNEILVSEWIIKKGGIIKLPSNISFQEAALIEPLACCIRAWKKIKFKKNDSIAIFGFGPIGAMHSMIAKNNNLEKIFCIDIDSFRLNFCKSFNLGEALTYSNINWKDNIHKKTKERGVDICIIATSNLSIINEAITITRKGGTILIFGEPEKNYKIKINMNAFYSKEISIIPTYAAANEEIKDALDLVENKKLNLIKLITHEFPIEQIQDAFNFSINGEKKMKIIVKQN